MQQEKLMVLLIPVLSVLLVSAQTIWTAGVRRHNLLQGRPSDILVNLLTSKHMWIGSIVYIIATLIYLFLLSRFRFFSVQVSGTAIAIVVSTFVSALIFKEPLSYANIAGAVLVLIGVPLVLYR